MSNKIISEGKCLYCDKEITARTIVTHLVKHLTEIEKSNKEKTKLFYHIEVKAKYDKKFFLQLLFESESKLKVIDDFLRDIWLECCGHISAFRSQHNEIKMNKKVGEVFSIFDKIDYDYDFGSTTSLELNGIKSYNLPFLDEKIILLSRNEPLKLICRACDVSPAETMCIVCCDENGFYAYCKKCAKKHKKTCEDFADYAEVEIVNSPRCGECGYTGGSIDLERDGVYKVN